MKKLRDLNYRVFVIWECQVYNEIVLTGLEKNIRNIAEVSFDD